jgi:hypothetical protein
MPTPTPFELTRLPWDPIAQTPGPSATDTTFRWATVTQAGTAPRFRLDGDTRPLPYTPQMLIDPRGLSIGQRVWTQMQGKRVVVLGVDRGGSTTEVFFQDSANWSTFWGNPPEVIRYPGENAIDMRQDAQVWSRINGQHPNPVEGGGTVEVRMVVDTDVEGLAEFSLLWTTDPAVNPDFFVGNTNVENVQVSLTGKGSRVVTATYTLSSSCARWRPYVSIYLQQAGWVKIRDISWRYARAETSPQAGVPLYILRGAGSKSIVSGGWNDLDFWTAYRPDPSFPEMWSASKPAVLKAPISGTYLVHGKANFAINATGHRVFRFVINNVEDAQTGEFAHAAFSAGNAIVDGSALLVLKAGDEVKMQAWQSSGGALTVYGYSSSWHLSQFSMRFMGNVHETIQHVTVEQPFAPDTSWKSLTLLNGWRDYAGGSAYSAPQYRKMANGQVEIRGLVDSGTALHIATLPVGYRPGQSLIFATSTWPNVYARLNLQADGALRAESGNYSATWISICCTYYADQ